MQENFLQTLTSRHSVGAKFLCEPIPTDADFREAAACALVAPDHCLLHPARFVVIENRVKLADFFKSGALSEGASEEEAAKARSKAVKAPAVVAVIAKIDPHLERVPVYEQWMTVGTAASNFLFALEAKGFAGKIVSGRSTTYPQVTEAFCKENERVACWIMLGTGKPDAPAPRPRASAEPFISYFS